MTINEVTEQEYTLQFQHHPHVFNTTAFAQLNAHKAEAVHYLLFVDDKGKTRFGIILGERGGKLLTPFSAPFGGLSVKHGHKFEYVDKAVDALCCYAKEVGRDIRVVLPPQFYDSSIIAECINVLSRRAELQYIDLNYYFPMSKFTAYEDFLERNARKNLRRAVGSGFEFVVVQPDDTDGIRRAYDIIRRNREEHGYPLRMSLQDVEATIKVVSADFFLLRHEGEEVAAAQVFHVADGIAQVIYWGDLRAYSTLRPMNYLAYRVFAHYYREGLRFLDIGPSTEDGVPNYGLCDFKTGIGCDVVPKFVFEIKGR